MLRKRDVIGCAAGMIVLMLGGCASSGHQADERIEAVPLEPRAVGVFDGATGSAVSWSDMVGAASGADVVVIGEMHGHALGLASAAALWEDVIGRASDGSGIGSGGGSGPALSLEFFTRDEQAAVDDYLTGVTDEAGFRKASGRTEGNYPGGHRAMLEAAKDAGLRVHASNAPRRYTSLAREDGYAALAGLRASQRALFVTPGASPEGPYRDRFFELFRGMMASHGGADQTPAELDEKIEGYFRAQSVWDATMADTVTRAVAQGLRPVVHVVGQFHSDHRGGLIAAIERARPGARVVTVSMVEGPGFGGDDGGDLGRADFVVDVGGPEMAAAAE